MSSNTKLSFASILAASNDTRETVYRNAANRRFHEGLATCASAIAIPVGIVGTQKVIERFARPAAQVVFEATPAATEVIVEVGEALATSAQSAAGMVSAAGDVVTDTFSDALAFLSSDSIGGSTARIALMAGGALALSYGVYRGVSAIGKLTRRKDNEIIKAAVESGELKTTDLEQNHGLFDDICNMDFKPAAKAAAKPAAAEPADLAAAAATAASAAAGAASAA